MADAKQPKKPRGNPGVRLNPKHDEATRNKIKTTQLIKRLQGFSLSELDPQTHKPIEMSATQVNAALGLIKKTLPDLSSVDISGLLDVNLTKHEEAIDELE
jgi:hypothetical protein